MITYARKAPIKWLRSDGEPYGVEHKSGSQALPQKMALSKKSPYHYLMLLAMLLFAIVGVITTSVKAESSLQPSAGPASFAPIEGKTPVTKVKEYDDVRRKDLRPVSFADRPELPASLTFDEATVWPEVARMGGFDPKSAMAAAMNPGLGIRALHRRGITGKGVIVAIIDQPLAQDHPEYAGKIAAYYDFECGSQGSTHGSAVMSLLVGTRCGTAPDARVYYAAVPTWLRDAAYYAAALGWIIDENEKVPECQKIRVVSVSASPSGNTSSCRWNREAWDEARALAEASGILVIDCTRNERFGFIGPCALDPANPDDITQCTPGYPGLPWARHGTLAQLLAPASPRSMAEADAPGTRGWQYNGRGGQSWTLPYIAGVLALGWQVRPELSPSQMRELLLQSAYTLADNSRIVNPPAFVEAVTSAKALPYEQPRKPGTERPDWLARKIDRKVIEEELARQTAAFVDDPRMLGSWRSVDVVQNIRDFIPGGKPHVAQVPLRTPTFLPGGRMPGDGLSWTKGMIVFKSTPNLNRVVEILKLDGRPYLFIKLDGDSAQSTRVEGMLPPFYIVLEKVAQ